MGIFNADRPLGKMLADAYDLMLLSVLWFVGCLPIVTIVTSTTALLFVCGKKLRGEEIQVGADFYKSYRQNFKMSFPLLLILGIFWFGSLFYLFIGYRSLLQKMTLAWLFIIILIFELVVLTAFILLLFSRYETSIFQLLKNALFMSHAYLLQSLFIFLWSIGLSLLVLFMPGLFVLMPGVLACLINYFGGATIGHHLNHSK